MLLRFCAWSLIFRLIYINRQSIARVAKWFCHQASAKLDKLARTIMTTTPTHFSQNHYRTTLWAALLLFALALMLDAALAHADERSAQAIVSQVCAACHRKSGSGAPLIGDKMAWARRSAQGLTSLTEHALQGIRNMPAHGGNTNLSNIDLERAIIHMVNQSGGNWIEPLDKDALPAARSGEQVVKAKCGSCHFTGLNGAPKIGDRRAWIGRVSQGLDKVIASGIHGRGAMPARGGIADLSDEEMRAAVIYMFSKSTAAQQ